MTGVHDQQAVYVLNRRAYQETSLIVDVFSLHHGRFSIVAKGAMRKASAWSAQLQPFQSLLVSWSGRSTLKTLRSVDVPSEPFKLSSAYLFSAYYLNELLIKLLPEASVNEDVFACYVNALCRLEQRENLEFVLRQFEYGLLRSLGLLPDFYHDLGLHLIDPQEDYRFHQHRGFERAPMFRYGEDGLRLSGGVLCSIRGDEGYEASAWSKEDFQGAKALMRPLVDEALGGQVIKSRELFRQVKFKEK